MADEMNKTTDADTSEEVGNPKSPRKSPQKLSSGNGMQNRQAKVSPQPKGISQIPKKIETATPRNFKSERSSLSTKTVVPSPEKKFLLRKKSKSSIDLKTVTETKANINSNRPLTSIKSTTTTGSISSTTISPSIPRQRTSEIPSYRRKNEKDSNEIAFNTKYKQFSSLLKRLSDTQSEVISSFKTLKELQNKVKPSGKDLPPEEIKLIAILNNDNGELLIKNPCDFKCATYDNYNTLMTKSSKLSLFPFDAPQMIDIKSKLYTSIESGFKLCQELLTNLNSFPNQTQEAGDISSKHKLPDQFSQFINKMEDKILNSLKEEQSIFHNSLKELEQFATPQIIEDINSRKEYEEKIDELNCKIQELKKNLEVTQSKLNVQNNELSASKDVKKEILILKQNIIDKDHEIAKLKGSVKDYETKLNNLEGRIKNFSKLSDDKTQHIKKLESELHSKSNRMKTEQSIMDELKKQQDKILSLVQREKETLKQIENEQNERSKLEVLLKDKDFELNNLRHEYEKLNCLYSAGGDVNSKLKTYEDKCEELLKEKHELENEKNNLEKELYEKENEVVQLHKANQEINVVQENNDMLRNTVAKLENSISHKNSIIKELEEKLTNTLYSTPSNNQLRDELERSREIERQKDKEINALKKCINKNEVMINLQKHTIFTNQKLLKIRCELINTLQDKDEINRTRLENLSPPVDKNVSEIDKMNNEISARAEELQNLFSTLGTKQIELSQKDHIIEMLESNNDRLQKLRIKQENKIASLAREVKELRDFIRVANLQHKN